MMVRAIVIALILINAIISGEVGAAEDEIYSRPVDEVEYGYYYKNSLIVMKPSTSLLAVEADTGAIESFNAMASDQGLVKDPLSNREALKGNGFELYRKEYPGKGKTSTQANLASIMQSFTTAIGKNIQPVFEQGDALLIPFDEIIVGFRETTSAGEAENFFSANLPAGESIIEVREHRTKTFILKINNCSNGRVYEISRLLAKLKEVSFAEPNHIVVILDNERPDKLTTFETADEMVVEETDPPQEAADGVQAFEDSAVAASEATPGPQWTTIAFLDFESGSFPPSDWQLGYTTGKTESYWGKTSYHAYGGSFSIYCAWNGNAGVNPPGPAPVDMGAILRSPVYDLSGYEEVYIEVWFYAKNELYENDSGQRVLYDYPQLVVWNETTATGVVKMMGTVATGDLTADSTTQNGWRKLIYRIPPDYRVEQAFFDFRYISDDSIQFEGAYLDDIRIVATTDIDTNSLGNDTYGARQYELKNVGQVAGLGEEGNDLHLPEAWDLISVSSDVVVAVIDDGVDLTHPDLNLTTGYDYDGTIGGQARGYHGTGCAGNVGAIKDNGIGVIGTAPGVKIMPVYSGETIATLANSIELAVDQGAHVLSNSWGWQNSPSTDVENAILDAIARNRTVLFAAGNGPDREPWNYNTVFPCNLTESSEVICVGASSLTDEHKATASSDGKHSWGSSYVGAGPDIVAPGPWSYTTDIQGTDGYNDGSQIAPLDTASADYTSDFGGTSSSTPKVAGIVALMLSKNPDLTPAQVKSILRSTADDIDESGVDDKTGAGRVNAYQAVLNVPSSSEQQGYLVVNIEPTGALDEGAQWRVDEGVWQNSGVTVSGLSPGSHALEFKDIVGWTTPEDQTVAITADQTLTCTGTYVLLTGDQPNLAPYKPSSWSNKIVVSNVLDTTTDVSSLSPSDTLYLDWAIDNNGTAEATTSFITTIFLDGVALNSWITAFLDVTHYANIKDYSLGSLAAGTYQITIVTDAENTVVESDESDNSYTKTITVGESESSVNLTPYKPTDWSDKIVVSTGTGTSTDSTNLSTADSLYIDFAVANDGISDITDSYEVILYIDGNEVNTWLGSSLQANYYGYVTDYPAGKLYAGTHTIKIVADPNNAIAENNEEDNSYEKTITVTGSSSNVNLTPCTPDGWSDGLVISTESGTNSDSSTFLPDDTVYVDWAVINNGTEDITSPVTVTLFVDGIQKNSWTVHSLTAGFYTSRTDYSLGSLSAGSHQITITADPDDTISETGEEDNSVSKIIVVGLNLLVNGDFENGCVAWTEESSDRYHTIYNIPGLGHNSSDWYINSGTDNSRTEATYQDVLIPQNADEVKLQFWYKITTDETSSSYEWDLMDIEIQDPADGTLISIIDTFSNLDATQGWVASPKYDLSSYRGKSIRLNFMTSTDFSAPTAFRVDDVSIDLKSIYELYVNSFAPATSVFITAAPDDTTGSAGGFTSFTLSYLDGQNVTLTAPAAWDVLEFRGWDGCDSSSLRSCTVQMDQSRSVMAMYDFPLADNDGDGLPDAFETFYGIDTGSPGDLVADADGDGYCNYREYLGLTSPADQFDIPAPIADRDMDNDVDGHDLNAMINEMNRACTLPGQCFFDFNGDGVVDNIDLLLFGEDFGREY